jgi:competence protein ComEA
MNSWKILSLGVIIGLFSSGLILLISKGVFKNEFELQPLPTTAPLVVHIIGGVAEPGVYQVGVNSRIQDVVEAAGGFSTGAMRESINLAEMVSDGQQISIPFQEEVEFSGKSSINNQTAPSAIPVINRVNINTADNKTLSTLAGIGPITAANIIEYRQTHGSFSSIDELMKVKGIGISTFEEVKDYISIR